MKGIYVPLMTPFDQAGELLTDNIAAMVEYHIGQGVHGFYIGGSSGECFLLSIQERMAVLQAVSAANQGRVGLIAHVGAMATRDALVLAKCAAECGFNAISATPPFYYGFNRDEITTYYSEIARNSELPLLLYNIPGTTGVSFTVNEVLALHKLPNVIGLKHTTMDMFFVERLKAQQPESVVFHGEDTMLINGLQMGADGGIGSTYNLMSGVYVDLYNAFMAGDFVTARQLQTQVNDVTSFLLKNDVYQSIKTAMKLRGIDYGYCRAPFAPLSKEKEEALEKFIAGNTLLSTQ